MAYRHTDWENEPETQTSSSRSGGPPRNYTGIGLADEPVRRPRFPVGQVVWMLLLASLGYLGAAAFYSHLSSINAQRWACPVCPNIDGFGAPIHKFAERVMMLGTLNALIFVAIGWLIISLARSNQTK